MGIIFIHYHFNKNKVLSKVYFPALLFKFFCGLLLYQLHLSFAILPDLIFYQQDIVRLSDYFWNDTSNYLIFLFTGKLNPAWNYTFATEGERAFFFMRYLSLMNLLAAKNMYLTSLYSSLMAFFGLWACANRLADWFKKYPSKKIKLALSIGFFFTPSVAFWASSMMKESFLWLIVGFLISFFLDILKFYEQLYYSNFFLKDNKSKFVGIVIKLFLFLALTLCLFLLKYYYFALLIPLLFAFGISFFIGNYFNKNIRFQLFTFLASFVFIVGLASNLHPNLWLSRVSEAIFINQQNILATSDFDSQIDFIYDYDFEPLYYVDDKGNREYQNFPSLFQLFEQSPKALLAGLFFPLEIDFSALYSTNPAFNFYRFASVIENWIILFFFIHTFSIKKLFHKIRILFISKNNFISQKNELESNSLAILWLVGIIFCLGMATLLALSAPNLGALVRYKIGFLPFFIFGIIMRLD